MRAFSYASGDKDGGYAIRSAVPENPMLHANITALRMFDRTGVIADRSFTLHGIVYLFAPVTLTLTR